MTHSAQFLHNPVSISLTSDVQYNMGCGILSEMSVMNIEKAMKERNWLEVISVVRKTMKTVSSAPVSIAVTGDSGNGMSSFINALRRIGHEEEDSAPTGVVRTTQIPTCYTSSLFPNVALWDLPGTGAALESLENYLEKMQFSQYDIFIIIASEQFSRNLAKLAKTIQGLGKRFYIVWTKLDRDLTTRICPEEKLLQDIRDNIRETLQEEGVCIPLIFLVSSFYPLLHDFPELRDTLHRDISDIRYRGPLENVSHVCEKVINDKVITLQEKIGSKSFQDTLGIQNEDDLHELLYAYRLHFDVDDKSLQQVAQSLGKPMEEYKATMKSQDLHTVLTENRALSWINCYTASYLYSILSYIPYVGYTSISYLKWWNQSRFLEIVAEDTKTILKKILKDSII